MVAAGLVAGRDSVLVVRGPVGKGRGEGLALKMYRLWMHISSCCCLWVFA